MGERHPLFGRANGLLLRGFTCGYKAGRVSSACKADFVTLVDDLLTHTHAKARRVHLVIDNLNIHSRSASSVVNA